MCCSLPSSSFLCTESVDLKLCKLIALISYFKENPGVYLKCTIILNGSVRIIIQTILLCIAEIAIQPNWILPAKMVFFMLPDLVLLISKTNMILMLHKLC